MEPGPQLGAGGTPAAFHYGDGGDPQTPRDVAVMMVTVVRPSIVEALRSIYRQTYGGRIQLVIGVDVAKGDPALLEAALAERPPNVSALVYRLPYSTAARNGGLHAPNDGGALRCVLAASAHARWLAQLDDDNVWLPDHLAALTQVMPGRVYAFTQRLLVDEDTGLDLGVDVWDSVGPGAGRFAPIGGFVDPNCLMIDKVAAVRALGAYADTWNRAQDWTADRVLFAQVGRHPHGRTDRPTVRYQIRRNNVMWARLREAKLQGALDGYAWPQDLAV